MELVQCSWISSTGSRHRAASRAHLVELLRDYGFWFMPSCSSSCSPSTGLVVTPSCRSTRWLFAAVAWPRSTPAHLSRPCVADVLVASDATDYPTRALDRPQLSSGTASQDRYLSHRSDLPAARSMTTCVASFPSCVPAHVRGRIARMPYARFQLQHCRRTRLLLRSYGPGSSSATSVSRQLRRRHHRSRGLADSGGWWLKSDTGTALRPRSTSARLSTRVRSFQTRMLARGPPGTSITPREKGRLQRDSRLDSMRLDCGHATAQRLILLPTWHPSTTRLVEDSCSSAAAVSTLGACDQRIAFARSG